MSPLFPVDDGYVLNLSPVWARDVATRKKILGDNPTRLYAFGEVGRGDRRECRVVNGD